MNCTPVSPITITSLLLLLLLLLLLFCQPALYLADRLSCVTTLKCKIPILELQISIILSLFSIVWLVKFSRVFKYVGALVSGNLHCDKVMNSVCKP